MRAQSRLRVDFNVYVPLRVAASVRYVSSTLGVLKAKLYCLLRREQTKNVGLNRTNTKAVTLF